MVNFILGNVKNNEVARHFNKDDHSYTDMEVSTLMYAQNVKHRKQTELMFIIKLETVEPCGMNVAE